MIACTESSNCTATQNYKMKVMDGAEKNSTENKSFSNFNGNSLPDLTLVENAVFNTT